MRTLSACPFCDSPRLTIMARTERLTHKSCKRCYKLWAEPNVQPFVGDQEADRGDGLDAPNTTQ
jgi:hypothetical protein